MASQVRVPRAIRDSGFFKPGAADLHSRQLSPGKALLPQQGKPHGKVVYRTLILESVSPGFESWLCHLQARGPSPNPQLSFLEK